MPHQLSWTPMQASWTSLKTIGSEFLAPIDRRQDCGVFLLCRRCPCQAVQRLTVQACSRNVGLPGSVVDDRESLVRENQSDRRELHHSNHRGSVSGSFCGRLTKFDPGLSLISLTSSATCIMYPILLALEPATYKPVSDTCLWCTAAPESSGSPEMRPIELRS